MIWPSLLVAAACLMSARADVYMHMPRGSNDRNCERNVNRDNGNRLFNSQNNAAGGYACPRAVGNQDIQPESGIVPIANTAKSQSMRTFYYEKSILPIEWTNQHGCGANSKVNCEIVLQYACRDTLDPMVDNFWPFVSGKNNQQNVGTRHFQSGNYVAAPRDGVPRDSFDAATDTIPDSVDSATPSTVETRRYGMHESNDYYQLCQRTQRNKGLYTADQNLRRNDQRGTRQNPDGNRHGYECPEERDYYPWWHPAPWVDIAVLSNDANTAACTAPPCGTQRCTFYLQNSFNVADKCYCDVDHTTGDVNTKLNANRWRWFEWYNNQAECEANGFVWYCVNLNEGMKGTTVTGNSLTYPVCVKTQYAEVNHLGSANPSNGGGAEFIEATNAVDKTTIMDAIPHGSNKNRFIWQIPTIPTVDPTWSSDISTDYLSCTLRMRYNITSSDFPVWPNAALDPSDTFYGKMVDYRNNSKRDNDPNTPIVQDPYVYVGPGVTSNYAPQFLSLAVNTNQYGRTFQDRSYVFSIKKMPNTNTAGDVDSDTPRLNGADITSAVASGSYIYNIGVRGKRGNIVQTFPSTEYDFVPNSLRVKQGDYIHFQWTGSDYNPRRGCNDAEGGPPDPNLFFTNSNNDNARADRSNICLKLFMASEQPRDYLGYEVGDASSYSTLLSTAKATITPNAFCYSSSKLDECYDALMRLCFLNQDQDGLSLSLRQSKPCLTETELDAIVDKNSREQHPLNCAKLNAKPYPYFNGGVVAARQPGIYAYFSSRNNNFSNRDHSGVLCVHGGTTDCASYFYTRYSIIQDNNPQVEQFSRRSSSYCNDETSGNDGANNNGAASCIPYTGETSTLTGETFAIQQADSDARGDGQKKGCEVLQPFWENGVSTTEAIGLAVGLLFVGLATSWGAYYAYNRYRAHKADGAGVMKGDKSWQKKPKENEMI